MPHESCDVCGSTEVADCIGGEMYLCAQHLAAWEASPIDDPDRFIAEQQEEKS